MCVPASIIRSGCVSGMISWNIHRSSGHLAVVDALPVRRPPGGVIVVVQTCESCFGRSVLAITHGESPYPRMQTTRAPGAARVS
jgi:hypothetical protein